ncbi:hypothetical protein ACIGXF_37210, partial [Streptomyces sp. NPDC053086]
LGWVLLGWQPRGGRIGGRAARDRAEHPLLGGFTIEDTPAPAPHPAAQAAPSPAMQQRPARAPHPSTAPDRPSSAPRRTQPVSPALAAGPVSGVQQLLALAQNGGAR